VFCGRYGFATGEGSFTEQRASLVGGIATEKASFTAAAQFYHRDALKTPDRGIASMGFDELMANNINPYYVSYMSPSFPGKVQDTTGSYILRGSPLIQQFDPDNYRSDPFYRTPPRIPDGMGGYKVFSGPTAVYDYNNDPYWASIGMESPYVADPGAVLNTPLFGTHSIQSQDRRNVFGSATYDLFDKQVQLFAEFLFANIESEGALAPSPVVGLGAKQSNINIPANNIYNPFQIALGPNAGPGGLPPGGPRVRSRFVDSGNRLFDSLTDYYHITAGLEGEFESGWSYNAAYNYNCYDQVQFTRNAVNGAALELALTPNSNPELAALGLSQLLGANGQPVPMYNIFSVGGNDPATVDAIRATLFQSGKSEEWDAGGVITGNPIDLPGGKLGVAVGGAFCSESLSIDFDGLTKMGKVPGLNPAWPTHGRRDSWAGFVEVRIPLTSPEMDIPALRSFEVTAAGRYESFDPGGDSAVPKVAVRWQPLDEQFTLRASYAQSFVAPSTYELFGGDQVSVPVLGVPRTGDPDSSYAWLQEYTVWKSNSKLEPADAESWTAGIVISPKAIEGLTISLDYYHIKTKNDIFRVDEQSMVDSLNELGVNSPWQPYFFKADGTQITTTAVNQANDADWGILMVPLLNGAAVKTDGFDVAANYVFNTGNLGRFNFYANANVLLNYEYSDPVAGGPYKYAGYYSDPVTGAPGGQGTLPDFQLATGVGWEMNEWTVLVNARYIPEVTAWGSADYTMDGSEWTVDSWYSIDMQLAYEFGKNKVEDRKWYDGTRIAIGCNNITDNEPPLIAGAFEDNTDKSTYDIIGRFLYFEISKKF